MRHWTRAKGELIKTPLSSQRKHCPGEYRFKIFLTLLVSLAECAENKFDYSLRTRAGIKIFLDSGECLHWVANFPASAARQGQRRSACLEENQKWNRISCQTPAGLILTNSSKAYVITVGCFAHSKSTAGVLRFIKCTSQVVPRPWGRAKRFCRWGAYSTMKTVKNKLWKVLLNKLMAFK